VRQSIATSLLAKASTALAYAHRGKGHASQRLIMNEPDQRRSFRPRHQP
jgi:hypothetical protein